ncbi:MAG TPA: PrpF domain-containing protein, partial [Bradyrhizobium sp.]
LVSKSSRSDCDVDYLFGAVSIEKPVVDWSGNCGNLTSAVGPFAIARGLVAAPRDGVAIVRIWQANIGKKIIAHVPVHDGEVVELGDFELDGVTFPSAEVRLEFLDPGADEDGEGGAMFPTGHRIDTLDVPGVGLVEATLINAGNPTIFVEAAKLGLKGTELQDAVNGNAELLAKFETIRAHALSSWEWRRPRRKPPISVRTRRRSPSSRRPRPIPLPAAKKLSRMMSTYSPASCPWASCTMP